MYKLNKFSCTQCNDWFSMESLKEERNLHVEEWDKTHKVTLSKVFTAEDYCELWTDCLEDANRHSLTEMPMDILAILMKTVKDKEAIKKTMKLLYEKEIGI